MKLKLAGFAVTAIVAVGMLALAQPPGRRAAQADATPPADAVKTYLSLSDSQLAGFEAVRMTARTASQPIAEQMRAKSQALQAALTATPVNAATIDGLRSEIAALEAQIQKIQADARVQMVALLSADQKTKLAALSAAADLREEIQGAAVIGLLEGGRGGPGGRGKGGKGGPGGPGGRGKGKLF